MRKVIKTGIKKKTEKIDLFGIGEQNDELLKNLSRLIFSGNEELHIDGYKCITEYTSEIIKVNLIKGSLTVIGKEMCISTLNGEEILINGKFLNVEFG